jgi:hypothetical protein
MDVLEKNFPASKSIEVPFEERLTERFEDARIGLSGPSSAFHKLTCLGSRLVAPPRSCIYDNLMVIASKARSYHAQHTSQMG